MKGSEGLGVLPELPKCHPTIRGRWKLLTYEAFQRKPGAIFDLTYHGDDGNEIVYFTLKLQPDGVTLAHDHEHATAHLSHQPQHTSARDHYLKRNTLLFCTHYDEIMKAILAVARQYETGELKPEALGSSASE
jgi:hypothetical protein